jgi:hypothetical protein
MKALSNHPQVYPWFRKVGKQGALRNALELRCQNFTDLGKVPGTDFGHVLYALETAFKTLDTRPS